MQRHAHAALRALSPPYAERCLGGENLPSLFLVCGGCRRRLATVIEHLCMAFLVARQRRVDQTRDDGVDAE